MAYRTSLTTPALSNLFRANFSIHSADHSPGRWPAAHAVRGSASVPTDDGAVTKPAACNRSVGFSVRPIHLFDPKLQTMISNSNSLWRGSGMPIHLHGVLLHAMSGTELSRVRTELH